MKKVARADGFLLMNRLGLLTLGYFSFVWLSIGRDSDSARTSRSVPLCGSFFYYYYCKIIIILVPFSFPVLLFDWRVGPAVHCFRLKRTHSVTIRRICRGETSPSVARRLVFDKIIFSSPLKKPTDVIHQAGSQKPQLSGALIRVDADRIPFHLVRRRKKQASVNLFKSFGFVLFLFFGGTRLTFVAIDRYSDGLVLLRGCRHVPVAEYLWQWLAGSSQRARPNPTATLPITKTSALIFLQHLTLLPHHKYLFFLFSLWNSSLMHSDCSRGWACGGHHSHPGGLSSSAVYGNARPLRPEET